MYQIHHRALDLGLVGLVLFAPSLLLVLVTGAVVDRFDRKAIVIASALVELAASLGLLWQAVTGTMRLDVTLAVLFVVGIARAFGATAERTILINIVDDERYMPVSALYSSVREVVVIAGPAAGGVLVALSPAFAFGATAVMIALAVSAFSFVRLRRTVRSEAPPSWQTALEGFRFVRSQPVLLGAISLDLFAVLLGGATALLPIYASEVLHVGAVGFGVLRSSVAVGAFATGLALHRYPPTRHTGALLLACVASFGVATIVFAFARELWVAVAALVTIGAVDMISVVIRTAIVQLNTPDAMRGRVSAIEMLFIGASNELGEFESGFLAQLIGAVGAAAAGGVATLLIVAVWAVAFPALVRSDRIAPPAG